MISATQEKEITELIYDSILQPNKWQKVLKKIANSHNAPTSLLRVKNKKTKAPITSITHNMPTSYNILYEKHFYKKDVLIKMLDSSLTGKFFIDAQGISKKAFCKTELYNDLILNEGVDFYHFMGGNMFEIDNTIVRLSLIRAKNQKGFTETTTKQLKNYIKPFKQAFLLSDLINQYKVKNTLQEDLINQSDMGIAFYNQSGDLIEINNILQNWLQNTNSIKLINSFMLSQNNADDKKLHMNLLDAINLQAASVNIDYGVNENNNYEFDASIIPIKPEHDIIVNISEYPAAMLLLKKKQSREQKNKDIIYKKYNFTIAEQRLTDSLVDGLSLKHSAEKLLISYNTAKSQLKSIFSKTGTNRQIDLINLINKQ